MRLYPKNSGKNPSPNYVPPASTKLKRLFCKHNNENEIICWHWTHGINGNEIRSVEAQLKCNDCGKYHFLHIYDWNKCDEFIAKHKDKQWSKTCKPVL